MRCSAHLLLLPLFLVGASLHAQQFATRCHASSSYDLTVQPDRLIFDRPAPAPQQLVLRDGALRADGAAVSLRAEDQDRLAVFERELRNLLPRVRTVGRHAVDMAVQALRAEAAGMQLSAAAQAALDRQLTADAAEVRQRIDRSNSTHDWQGGAAEQLANRIVADLSPIVAGDLGQQALQAAMSGDLETAARLRDQAADLATALRPRLERRMQALAPQVDALCPSIERLAELQQGVRGADGQPLRLLQLDAR
ncbi:DUF2884 family protein [Dyella sp.]|uniref:DUF2884 family protein n=1 Tax=Dyella sp. TaxID=1869338 RepID=UPI002D7A11F6|nr:DUF2884 family protein [Dyella sp.]HET6431865.1 DUF2884 family protein [Dyella sp.]